MPQSPSQLRPPVWYLIVAVAVVALVAAAYSVLQIRSGEWMSTWRQVPITATSADQGFAVSAATGRPEWTSETGPSPALMLEDRRLLSPPNAPLEDVRAIGRGRFRFSAERVYWSASDNTDPRSNGRHYSIVYPPIERATARTLYRVTLGAVVVFAIVSLIVLPIRAMARRLLVMLIRLPAKFSAAIEPRPAQPLPCHAVRWVVIGCAAALALTAIGNAIFLTRVGRWTALWEQAPISSAAPELGVAYYADLGRDTLSSQLEPSPAQVLEDGRQLGPGNALHSEIRELGRGRFSFWATGLYFSASDNSDPRTNGRSYAIWYPPISRAQARLFYVVTGLVDLLVVVWTLLVISRGGLGARMASLLAQSKQRLAVMLALAASAGLVLVAFVRATDSLAPFADAVWTLVLLGSIIAAAVVRWQFGPELPRRILVIAASGVMVAYIVLAAFSPHRSQGCHTDDALSIWDAFCLSGDSGSYLQYSVGSTRQPLYPWFNHLLTRGTNFEYGSYIKNSSPGRLISDHSDPLSLVVRTQIVLALGASLFACIALMRLFASPLPATLFVWLFDHQFFSNSELNTVLTEPLVLTLVCLLLAVFLSYVRAPRPWLIPIAATICAGAYLTRQAAAYSGIFVAAMVLHALAMRWRRTWPACAAACVAFVGVAAIPDIYGFIATGNLGQQQTSLQYQYRIAHAMQYLDEEDVRRAPDEASREWLAAALRRRDVEHAKVEAQMQGPYLRMVYYVDRNLYAVATPSGQPQPPPEFLIGLATPILERHWFEYVKFGMTFWVLGLSWPEVARIGILGFSAWYLYTLIFAAVLFLRDRHALVAAACVLAHWSHVLLASFFAAPIPRMVGASEFLVIIAAITAAWGLAVRIGGLRFEVWYRRLQIYSQQAGEGA